ncbi:hypothetical protein OG596_18285 [Streptomyces sp. NBC_01102]|uniref:hypothetical protein n=1 Tax=Streptomyces sp. NBC_01102 TaxID=2903749 RepID=UPI00386D5B76|nr:hypothetical protein OG596_18285 [Streptomyces sp. NBC_01102]
MKQTSMHVTSLVLDETNPRYEKKTSSLEESLAALLGQNPEKLLRLAKDIAQHGINPTELPIVVVEGDRNVVVEGNRRVAALKLLGNPGLAPTEKLKKQFAAISKDNVIPRRVACVLAESRLQAEHWIMLRHDGDNKGVGIVPWSAAEKIRFSGRSTPTGKALLFIDAASEWFADDVHLVKDAHAVRNGRITNLGRMLADPYVRNRLGLSFEGDVVLSGYSREKMKPLIRRLFSDLAGSVTVDQIKSKEQRKDYLQQVEDDLPRLADRLEIPQAYSKSGAEAGPPASSEGAVENGGSDGKPAKRRRADFEKRLFQGVVLRHVSLRTSEVLDEAKRLRIDEMPNVAAIMVRAVVDIVVTEVAQKLSWRRNQDTLKGRIGAVLSQVDPSKDNPELANAWRFSQQEDGALVLRTLHSFVHTWASTPLTSDVRKLSMAYGPLLLLADELLEKKGR